MIRILVSFILLMILTGCQSPKVVLHPILGTDIHYMPAGQPYSPAKDGYFLSKEYLVEVAEAKVVD